MAFAAVTADFRKNSLTASLERSFSRLLLLLLLLLLQFPNVADIVAAVQLSPVEGRLPKLMGGTRC